MVDRGARLQAAAAIKGIVGQQISWDKYEETMLLGYSAPDDRALRAAYTYLWFCYSDFGETVLADTLTAEGKAAVDRWYAFLLSDLEYPWPESELMSFLGLLRWLPPVKRCLERRAAAFKAAGDVNTWPFVSIEDYQRVKAQAQFTSLFRES